MTAKYDALEARAAKAQEANKRGIWLQATQRMPDPEALADYHAMQRFGEAQNPAAVLGLIADVKALAEALQEANEIEAIDFCRARLQHTRVRGINGIAVDEDYQAIEWRRLGALRSNIMARRIEALARIQGEGK